MQKPITTPTSVVAAETRGDILRQAIQLKLQRHIDGKSELRLPAVPALIDHYTRLVRSAWLALNRMFTDEDLGRVRATMLAKAEEAFAASPYSMLSVVSVTDPQPKKSISWTVDCIPISMADTYTRFMRTREPPLFGQYPDVKVMDVAKSLTASGPCMALDLGAGTGRNTLPLARLGCQTDAIEAIPALANQLRHEVQSAGLNIGVIEGNFLEPNLVLQRHHYRLMVLSEVVSHFRSTAELKRLFTLANQALSPGGLLLFNAFVAYDGYEPDALVRQFSQAVWSSLFTKDELLGALDGLALELVSNESARDYERAGTPPDRWPPTGWYEDWSAGENLFALNPEQCPMELRWLVCRKAD